MRLDQYLYINNYCESRTKAQNVIKDSRVKVNGKIVDKVSFDIGESDDVELLKSKEHEFVGRGGNKLEHALNYFNINVNERICLDIGASTGGFTECLLMHGAKKVFAVDSGINQLSHKLKSNPNVVSMEGFNARNLSTEHINGESPSIIVMDVSFISQTLIHPSIATVLKDGGEFI